MSIIVGTAGHVDHGKTMLIKALTGVDTDRLQEEKKRGISIDLGFAPLQLSAGRVVGVVDVPGHERFIHNMLAGAGGVDLVLLVVDATEGIMPQTREHLSILELLQVKKGLVAITKCDLVEEEWLELVEEEVKEELQHSFLAKAPIIRTSAVTGQGIEELKNAIDRLTDEMTGKDTTSPLRIPIDRVFVKDGFGLVITGTLLTGQVRHGDNVAVIPPGIESRVRGIQVHGAQVELAQAGQRVALNLSGLEKEQLERGAVVASPGIFNTTSLLDVRLKLLPDAPHALKHAAPVHFYLGTARTVGRVVLLNSDQLKPGEEAYCQFRLEKKIVAQRGDKFIIRSYSPMFTVGGGVVLDENPARHKRYRPQIISHLQKIDKSEADFLLYKLREHKWLEFAGFQHLSKMGAQSTLELLEKLQEEGLVVKRRELYFPREKWQQWKDLILQVLKEFHAEHPLLPGYDKARLKSLLPQGFPNKAMEELLGELYREKQIEVLEDVVRLAGFKPELGRLQTEVVKSILSFCQQKGFRPPSVKEVSAFTGLSEEKLVPYLIYLHHKGDLIKVSEDLYLASDVYDEAFKILVRHFSQSEKLTLAQYRDLLESSRRFAQSLLEHFDGEGYTRRTGDVRVAWKLPVNQE